QQRQPDLPLVVVQTPDDQQLTADLLKVCPSVKVTRPSGVGKLAAMIAAANLVLCTDGAPLYLAIALQVYTMALFGPTDPENLMPKSDKFQSIKSSTGRTTDIAPEQVLAKVWGN
ncbi:MAG TPA: glycosyltransferase family 9 protein, partial [Allocoleopsis sp.]